MLTKSILTATAIALVASVLIVSGTISVAAQGMRSQVFFALLSGDEGVPPVNTNAQGVVILRSTDEFGLYVMIIDYRLIVNNIENVFAAHIHCAPVGSNGPVGVTLFSGAPSGGLVNGVLVKDAFSAPDGGAGDCGWSDLEDVVDAIENGEAYVNVHTSGVPSGEIRGQLTGRPQVR